MGVFYRHRRFWVALGLVLLLYLIAFDRLPRRVFWAADEGAKYIQLQTLLGWQGGAGYALPYRGYHLDPAYRFYPQHPIYPQPLAAGRVRFHWPIWFPLLSTVPFKLLGLPGLYLIPLLGGLLTALLSGRLAARFMPAAAPAAMIVVGLASPIFLYSLLFWEHTLVVLLALVALWAAMGLETCSAAGRWRRLALVALLLTGAVALRIEMLFYALALTTGLLFALAIQHRPRRRPPIPAWSLGLATMLLVALAWPVLIFAARAGDFPVWAWLGPRVDQTLETGLYYATNLDFWLSFPTHLRRIWINAAAGAGPEIVPGWGWLGLAGLLAAGLAGVGPARFRFWLLLAAGLFLGSVSARVLFLPVRYRTLHSLFLAAPYLLFMVLFIEYARRARRFEATLWATTTGLYLILGTAAAMFRQAGLIANVEWGARYLLTMYPLGGICAVVGLGHLPRITASVWQKRLLGGLAILLAGLGLGYQIRGLHEIRETKADLLPYAHALEGLEPPLVTDLAWFPAVLAVHFVDQEIYILSERAELYPWLEAAGGRVDTFVFAAFFNLDEDFIKNAPVPLQPGRSQLVEGVTFTEIKIVEP